MLTQIRSSGLSQAIRKDVASLQDQIRGVGDGVARLQVGRDEQIRHQGDQTIVDWLSPLSFSAKQNDCYDRVRSGTGRWLLEESIFKEWLDGNTRTLWCPGIPGAGKTVLASIVIHHVQQLIVQKDIGLAYAYCSYKAQEQSAVNLIAALSQQLLQQRPQLPNEAIALYKKHLDNQSRPSLSESADLLRNEICRFSKVFVVIDALDEISEQEGTRNRFLTEIQKLPLNACLLITSRDIATIGDRLKMTTRLEIRATEEDIRSYIKGRIGATPQLAGLLRGKPALKDTISNAVVDQAKGM